MCGLVAVFSDGPIDRHIVDRMRDRLAHRGPDGAGTWIGEAAGGYIALAHRRLSIIDLREIAAQPMVAEDGRIVLVYNGEIYNFVELRAELTGRGHRFKTNSDSEVLIAAYLHWGQDFLSRLNGMFAFVLWDAKIGKSLIARDRFGEKPLYWAALPEGGIAFASEAKALFCHPSIPARVDAAGLRKFALGGPMIDGERTLFEGVSRVPPAHAMWVSARGRLEERWRYWTPQYAADAAHADLPRLADEFGALLSASVSMRLRSDVPVGACVSGGLDSSTIVGMIAAGADAAKLRTTFSARYDDDPTISEGPYIDMVLAKTKMASVTVTPRIEDAIADSRRVHWHQEAPFLSASIFNEWYVMRAARDAGTRVVIDGQGADELLGGYQYYFPEFQRSLAIKRQAYRLLANSIRFKKRLRAAAKLYVDSERRFPMGVTAGNAELWRLFLSGDRALDSLSAGDRTGLPDPHRSGRFRFYIANAIQYDMLPTQLLSADRSAMAFGVESRFPFLDHNLVDWCNRLPECALIDDGWQKILLRRCGAGMVPDAVRWRADKVGYAAPADTWLRTGMRDWARGVIFDGPAAKLDYFPREALEATWNAHMAGENRAWFLWRWLSISEWLSLSDDGAWTSSGAGISAGIS